MTTLMVKLRRMDQAPRRTMCPSTPSCCDLQDFPHLDVLLALPVFVPGMVTTPAVPGDFIMIVIIANIVVIMNGDNDQSS